jgi:hypothetical protein
VAPSPLAGCWQAKRGLLDLIRRSATLRPLSNPNGSFVRAQPGNLISMAPKVWTAAELDEMEPAEVDALFQASIVTDLDQVPLEFLARVRADVNEHIAAAEASRKR